MDSFPTLSTLGSWAFSSSKRRTAASNLSETMKPWWHTPLRLWSKKLFPAAGDHPRNPLQIGNRTDFRKIFLRHQLTDFFRLVMADFHEERSACFQKSSTSLDNPADHI